MADAYGFYAFSVRNANCVLRGEMSWVGLFTQQYHRCSDLRLFCAGILPMSRRRRHRPLVLSCRSQQMQNLPLKRYVITLEARDHCGKELFGLQSVEIERVTRA